MERKVKVAMPPTGAIVDGLDVPVTESTERWTEVKLEDGSVLRLKPSVLAAIRIPGQFDPDGNPIYTLKTHVQMTLAEAPEALKRGYIPKKVN